MINKLKAGKTYSINQKQYTLHCMLEDNEQYCSGLARNESGSYFQVKQYKQPLTDDMKTAMRVLANQELSTPMEAREIAQVSPLTRRRLIMKGEEGTERVVKYESCIVEPHSGTTLAGYLNYNPEANHINKAIELCQLLQTIHSKGYALGNINLSNIEVTPTGLKLRSIECAQKTTQAHEKERDIQQLCQIMFVSPDVGPCLLSFDSCDEKLKIAISTPNIVADQLEACLILNQAGNNAYQRIIEAPKLAESIVQKYNQHKNDPDSLNLAIKSIIQGSFKSKFNEIRNQRSETANSAASTVVPEHDEFSPTPPSTPRLH